MRAMAITQFGNTDVFEEITLPKPAIKPGHVLIKVAATSVNPLDCKLRKGVMPHLISHFPMVLHGDVAGVVEEVGAGVTHYTVGDEVYGCAGGLLDMGGALSEYMLVDADLIAHKPQSISMREAAALPLVALTAWEALVTYANVQQGQRLLIHAGTGGVGHFAIQLAKHLGGQVFTTVSNDHKARIAKELGADTTINYRVMSVENYVEKHTQNKGFDIVFDTIGGENLPQCFTAASRYGQVISIQAAAQFDLSPAFTKGLTLHMVLQPLPLVTGEKRAHYGEILTKIARLVDEHKLRPWVDETQFSMREVGLAHQRLERGAAIGKIVLNHF